MTQVPTPTVIDRRTLRAQAHPIRAHILNILSEGPNSPSKMQKRMPNVSLNLVSHHIKVLLKHELIELVEVRKVKGGGFKEHIYRTLKRQYFTLDEWLAIDPDLQDPLSATIIQQIGEDVGRAGAEGRINELPDRHMSRAPLELDVTGWKKVVDALRIALTTILEAHEESVERSKVSGQELMCARVMMMQFPIGRDPADRSSSPESFREVIEDLRATPDD